MAEVHAWVVNNSDQKVGFTLDEDSDRLAHLKKMLKADDIQSLEVNPVEGKKPKSDKKDKAAPDAPKPPTKAELQSEIDKRNEGRDEADLIVPESAKNDDLIAALEADDTKQSPPDPS